MSEKKINRDKISKTKQKQLVSKKELTKEDFQLIYQSYYQKIFSFINSRVSRDVDAEDITSLVFERVLKKLPDFKWQGVSIVSWIYRIARNAIIDFYRKTDERNKDSSLDQIGDFLESDEKKIETLLVEGEEEMKLYNSLREFKENEQYLIYYKFFEDLSNKEIADITGLSETNVGTKLHRLRLKLKEILK